MRTYRRKMMSYVVDIDMNVEYIMTNGNQFILTDWIPLTDTKIEMYFFAKDLVGRDNLINTIFSSKGENGTIFSMNNGAQAGQGVLLFFWNSLSYNSGGQIKSVSFRGYLENTPQLLCMSKDSVEYYYTSNTTIPLNLRTQPCTTPLTLFTGCYNRAKLCIYGLKCWNNGILERDFVPAKKDGIYGLYDKVNKKFWRSSTGVDFLGKDK